MTRIELPFPVPLSACFKDVQITSRKTGKTFRTRAPTGRYKAWQKEALQEIMVQRPKKFTGEVSIYVRLVAPDKRQRDAGNCDKALLDILVKSGVITDDSNRYVRRLTFEWADDGPSCLVIVQPIEPAQPSLFERISA